MYDSKPRLQDNMIETLPMYVLYRYTNLISAKPNHWVALLQHGWDAVLIYMVTTHLTPSVAHVSQNVSATFFNDRQMLIVLTSWIVINSIADVQNRSLMGAAQENCGSLCNPIDTSYWQVQSGFFDTLSQSKTRDATWRVVGWVLLEWQDSAHNSVLG